MSDIRTRTAEFSQRENADAYTEVLKHSHLANSLRARNAQFKWTEAKVIHDSSENKSRGENWQAELLVSRLWPTMQKATEEVIIVSPYFVPGKKILHKRR